MLKRIGNNYVSAIFFGGILVALFWPGQAVAFTIGERRSFFVDASYDLAGRSKVEAVLRQVGDRVLIYAADTWWDGLSQIDLAKAREAMAELSVEFDKTIHPRLTRVLGSEWFPGIDNEARVTILITGMNSGIGGYFNTIDEYPRSQIPVSNEREMIYLNSTYINTASAKVFLAHEFQHMITYYQKDKLRGVADDIWLNEARSEYAATILGYDNIYAGSNLERRVRDFLRVPTDSLTEWQNEPSDYGAANLFMQYLVGRYGEQILTRMTQTDAVGIDSINEALAALGSADSFKDIFTNWIIANYINDCQLGAGQRYCYLIPHLTYDKFHTKPQISNFLTVREGAEFSFFDSAKDWAGRWYEILPNGSGLNLLFNFRAQPSADWRAALIVFDADGGKSLHFLPLDAEGGAASLISDFGERARSAVLIFSSQTKYSGFSFNDPSYQFSYSAQITSADSIAATPAPVPSPTPSNAPIPTPAPTPPPIVNPGLADGSLIRAAGDIKVYIIKGQYKRWLQTPRVFAVYPHLSWESIIEVTLEQAAFYKDAWLVRADGDYRVYEINGDLTKHWLNMSASQFEQSGRSWDMVYIINKTELDLYQTGAEVLK